MINFNKVTFVYPTKDILDEVSFEINLGDHTVLIGSNGTGKSTLIRLIQNPDVFTYEGDIRRAENMRIACVDQFIRHEETDLTSFEYLSEPFHALQKRIDDICMKMADEDAPADIYDQYQDALDEMDSVDGYNYENNIYRELDVAGLTQIAETPVNNISGGEYKLLSIIRSMLLKPQLLIMDEPDVFLDFENLVGLMKLLNDYDGTVLAITHNRLLLNQCFDNVMHLENEKLQQFPGTYAEYNRAMLETKLDMAELRARFDDYIEEQRDLVERLRKHASETSDGKIGRQLRARSSYLERQLAMRGEYPFIEPGDYDFTLPVVEESDSNTLLEVRDYALSFDREILKDVSFDINRGDKISIVGANGTGKTSLMKDLHAMLLEVEPRTAMFSQIYDDDEVKLSGGERNIRQIEAICNSDAPIILLDEPTSHLDIYAQAALEKALKEYKGTIVMVSHDFYTVTGCANRIFLLEDGTMREQSPRAYRKGIYKKYFDSDIFEQERLRKETEMRVNKLIGERKYEEARELL